MKFPTNGLENFIFIVQRLNSGNHHNINAKNILHLDIKNRTGLFVWWVGLKMKNFLELVQCVPWRTGARHTEYESQQMDPVLTIEESSRAWC